MHYCCRLTVYQWDNIYNYLRDYKGLHVSDEQSVRKFVEGVFWILKSGAQWRLLPREYGNWNHIYQRFACWADKGIWHKMLYFFAKNPDNACLVI